MRKVYSNEITSDNTYNGWSNYATWRVNLELVDGNDGLRQAEYKSIYDLSCEIKEDTIDFLETSHHNHSNSLNKGNDYVLDYALAFIDEVNFYEIADHIASDYPSMIKSDE